MFINGKIKCEYPDCPQTIKDNRWSNVRAQASGWFFGKDDTAFCPNHKPEWVLKWRMRDGGDE